MVSANVRIDKIIIKKVRKHPKKLELVGSEINIGRAPNTSKNEIVLIK